MIRKEKKFIDWRAPETQQSLRSLRTYSRKNVSKRSKVSRNRFYTPMGRSFPPVLNMKFTFNKVFNLVSSDLAVNVIQIRLNSIYDPDFTTGIGQLKATPWNEMSTIYQEYEVYGAKVIIKFQPVNNQNAGHVVFKGLNYGYSSPPNVDNTVANGPGYKSFVFSNSTSQYIYSQYFDLYELTGTRRGDDNMQSLMAASPSQTALLGIHQFTQQTGGVTAVYDVSVKYYTRLSKQNAILAQS